jgi:hypothetical protein
MTFCSASANAEPNAWPALKANEASAIPETAEATAVRRKALFMA